MLADDPVQNPSPKVARPASQGPLQPLSLPVLHYVGLTELRAYGVPMCGEHGASLACRPWQYKTLLKVRLRMESIHCFQNKKKFSSSTLVGKNSRQNEVHLPRRHRLNLVRDIGHYSAR